VHIGASRTKEFEYLKQNIWQHIQGWKEKLLSKAGKEVLIKAVAQAIPTYAMSCFDLTKQLCEEISALIARYWWSQQDKSRCHWISWEKMTKAKKDGGVGFRDLHLFNMAMLSRQGWWLLEAPDTLCAQVLKARYYPTTSVLEAQVKEGISYIPGEAFSKEFSSSRKALFGVLDLVTTSRFGKTHGFLGATQENLSQSDRMPLSRGSLNYLIRLVSLGMSNS
jgi:hypothetical protein